MGSNPITPGEADIILPAHTLLREALTIKGVPPGYAVETGSISPRHESTSLTINHSLGVVPTYAGVLSAEVTSNANTSSNIIAAVVKTASTVTFRVSGDASYGADQFRGNLEYVLVAEL